MAEISFRANLNAAEIPFLVSLLGRTVIIPGLDQNSIKSSQFAGSGESLDQGIPQILYAENVVPTDFGIQSVSYTPIISAAANTITFRFDQLVTLRDVNENTFLFSPAKGDCWVYDSFVGNWKSQFKLDPPFTGKHISKSNINGRTFVCFEKRGFYEYDVITKTLIPVTFSGLISEEIIGICNSGNYNIAYTVDTIIWSSLVDETDFVTSLSTGSASIIPQDLKGPIVCILPISGGMIIYTTKNVVVGLATNNSRFPFNFKEIANAGGLVTAEHASYENGLGTQYAWTSAGLQKITTAAAETIFPAATDFLAGRRLDEFDKETYNFTTKISNSGFNLKLTYLESRYLLISYGLITTDSNPLKYVLLYDTVLRRWGKLKIDHVDCFDYTYPNTLGAIPYQTLKGSYTGLKGIPYSQLINTESITPIVKKSIGFLKVDGSIVLLNFEFDQASDAVVLLGKFQITRNSLATLQHVEIENPKVNSSYKWNPFDAGSLEDRTQIQKLLTENFSIQVLPSMDGRNFSVPVIPTLKEAAEDLLIYSTRSTAKNHTISLQGAFHLRSVLFKFTKQGKR